MTKAAKCWSYTAGERGRNRVRVYEDGSRPLLAEFYEGKRRKRVSLGHRDRDRARRQADGMAAEMGNGHRPLGEDLTLRQLFDNYLREVTPEKSGSKQRHDRVCGQMFVALFGPHRKVRTLNRRDWERYIMERRAGRIAPPKARLDGVGNRQIEYDLKCLTAVLNWATAAANEQGTPLLDSNPLRGLPYPREATPRRPVLSQAQYDALRKVSDVVDWRFGLALVLVHETGHRIGAVRELRWSDIDLEAGLVRWRSDTDKIAHEHVTPMSVALRCALINAKKRTTALDGAWVLPAARNPTKACPKGTLDKWFKNATRLAGLSLAQGARWHSLRRKFATDLATTPLKVLCSLGGWKDPKTLITCYQHPSQDTLREALALRD